MSENAVPSRRSPRSNFGVPPVRFGNPVLSSRRKPTRRTLEPEVMPLNSDSDMPNLDGPFSAMNLQRLDDDSGSIRSRRSTVSVSSSIKKLSGRKETRQMLMKLKKRRLALELEGVKLEGEITVLDTKMTILLQQPFSEDDDQGKEQLKVLNELKNQLTTKRTMRVVHKNTSKCQLEMIEEERAGILADQKDEEKMAELLEEEEQNLGTIQEGTFTLDKPHRTVNNWQDQQRPPIALSQQSQQDYDVSTLMRWQIIKHDLPPFDGKFEEWPIFFSQYEMTTRACKLTDIENIQRLQKALKGEAREVVRAMLVSDRNVDRIMDILQQRYGKPKTILDTIFQQVESLPSLKDRDKKGFIKFVDSVRNLTPTAVAFECEPYLCNPRLLGSLVKKLPEIKLASWSIHLRAFRTQFPSLIDFAEWLEEAGREVEGIYDPLEEIKDIGRSENPQQVKKNKVFAAADQPTERKCLFCKTAGHRVPQCAEFKKATVEDRWIWVKKQNCCFGCLNFGHSFKECKSTRKCGVDECDRNHQLLHNAKQQPNVNPIKFCSRSIINLMVVPVTIIGPKKSIRTYAMLDTGSTMTLLDGKLAEEVGIRGDRKPLNFDGISGADQDSSSQVVQLKISASDGSEFQLTDVRTISKLPLPRQSVRKSTLKKWKHLKDLKIE
jgi:hypothetical protein